MATDSANPVVTARTDYSTTSRTTDNTGRPSDIALWGTGSTRTRYHRATSRVTCIWDANRYNNIINWGTVYTRRYCGYNFAVGIFVDANTDSVDTDRRALEMDGRLFLVYWWLPDHKQHCTIFDCDPVWSTR